MVYKKYIKRGDKLFGPYYYRSVKKDGKVITQYVKTPDDFPQKISPVSKKIRKNLLIFPILFLILIAGFFILKPVLTGKVILSIDNSYVSGESLFGELRLNLEPREFVPADTKVLINNKEFILKNLIKEAPSQGEFYVSGADIFGFGEGYGSENPEVSFVLDILTEKKEKTSEENLETETTETNETEEEIIEEEINETEESPRDDTAVPPIENPSEATPSEENPIENPLEVIEEPTAETPLPEETSIENELPQEIIESEEIPESSSAESEITGGAILNFFNKAFLTITGKTALENLNEVSGKVSKDKPFVYALEQGQTAKISPKEGDKKNSNKKINLEIINNTAIVTTDYLGEETEYLINLSELNIPVKDKNLEIKLVYNETEFYSLNKNLNFEALNETNQTIQEVNLTVDESLVQYGAVLGEPVKWKKKITTNESEIVVELPKEAENISIYKIETSNVLINESIAENLTSLATGNIILEYKSSKKGFFSKISQFFTGKAIDVTEKIEKIEINISENNGEYDIEYMTPGPIAFEKNTSVGKEVTISSDVHYENVLAYTEFYEKIGLEKIRMYKKLNGSRVPVDFVAYNENGEVVESESDLDDDVLNEIENKVLKREENEISKNKSLDKPYRNIIYGEEHEDTLNYSVKRIRAEKENLVSRIEWIVPSLSNQTYEIILITKAQHLDSNKNFISDIYEEVKALDNNWSEQINDSEYVRVWFEKNLTKENDITIYARSTLNVTSTLNGTSNSSNVSIEVYEFNKTEVIAEFSSIIDNEYNKVYLTNLTGSQNTFDLKIVGGSVEFDYIVDPITLGNANSLNTNTTYENNFTHLNVSNSSIVLYMPFDENYNSTFTFDYTNNSND